MIEHPEYTRVSIAAARALVDQGLGDPAIYLPRPSDSVPVLYRDTGSGLSQPDFDRLEDSGVSHLYVRHDEYRNCEHLLEAKLSELVRHPQIPPEQKAAIVHQVGTAVALDLTDGPVSSEDLGRASNIVSTIVGSVLTDPGMTSHMLQMAEHERSTASHMFVVSALAVALGAEVFGSDQRMLTDLGLAGMVHDLGKLAIDTRILNKHGPLTPDEIKTIQRHPIESVRLLGNDPLVTPSVRQAILQHHERVDGRGYPNGVPGAELIPAARILAIVDSFHAMVGYRSYRPPVTPTEATRILGTQAGRQFDTELLACWTTLFKRCHPKECPQEATKPPAPASNGSTRHEHRPVPARNAFASRPKRVRCKDNVSIRCFYAGRLHDATCAPDEFAATLYDISRGGLCLFSGFPMYTGEVVHVELNQSTHGVWLRGSVAWCRHHDVDSYRIGLRFVRRLSGQEVEELVPVEGIGSQAEFLEKDPAGNARPPCRSAEGVTSTDAAQGEREDALSMLSAMAAKRKLRPEDEDRVVALSASGDPTVRDRSIDLLARIETIASRRALLTLLGDADTQVRTHTVTIAGAIGMGEASYELKQLLEDPVPEVALSAAGALGRLEDQTGRPLVVKALQADGPFTRLAAHMFGEIVGHRFPANARGVAAARRYLSARKEVARKG